MLNCESFFRYCAEWHQRKELRSLLCGNDAAVHLLSASQLCPSSWQTNSVDAEDFSSSISLLVSSACCCKITAITPEEMALLRDESNIQMWWFEYEKSQNVPKLTEPSMFSDTTSPPMVQSHHLSDVSYAASVLSRLLHRAHQPSCVWKGSTPIRLIFGSGSCFSPLESPTIRLYCAALRVEEHNKKEVRLALPRGHSARMISAQALAIHRTIFKDRSMHIDDKAITEYSNGTSATFATLRWKLHKSSLPERVINAFSSPLLHLMEDMLEERDDHIRNKEELGKLSVLICHHLAILGFEMIKTSSEERSRFHSEVENDIFGGFHFRCRYCGAVPPLEMGKQVLRSNVVAAASPAMESEDEQEKLNSHSGIQSATTSPVPASEDHQGEKGDHSPYTVFQTTLTCSGTPGFNTHCSCCPWNNLFLSRVIQPLSSVNNTFFEATFALCEEEELDGTEEKPTCSASDVEVAFSTATPKRFLTFRFRSDELGYLLSSWRLRHKLSSSETPHPGSALECPEFQYPLFDRIHDLDVSKCVHLANRGSALYTSPEKVDEFLKTLKEYQQNDTVARVPLEQKYVTNMEAITEIIFECAASCEPGLLSEEAFVSSDLEALEGEVFQIGCQTDFRTSNGRDTLPDSASTTSLSHLEFDQHWEKLEQFYVGASEKQKELLTHQSRLHPFYDAIVRLGNTFPNSPVSLEILKGLNSHNGDSFVSAESNGEASTVLLIGEKRQRDENRTKTVNSDGTDDHTIDLRTFVNKMEGAVKKLRQEKIKVPPPLPLPRTGAGTGTHPASKSIQQQQQHHHHQHHHHNHNNNAIPSTRPGGEQPLFVHSKPGNADWSSPLQFHSLHHQQQQNNNMHRNQNPFTTPSISPQPSHPQQHRGPVFPTTSEWGSSSSTPLVGRTLSANTTAPPVLSSSPRPSGSVLGSSTSILGAASNTPASQTIVTHWQTRGGGGGAGVLSESGSKFKTPGGNSGKFNRRGGGSAGEGGILSDGLHSNAGMPPNNNNSNNNTNNNARGGRGGRGGRQKGNRGSWRGGRGGN